MTVNNLNKFFGIEDEESQQDYQSNIQPNDINIAKFKMANEFNSSLTRAFSFYIPLILCGSINFILWLILSFFDLSQFISVFILFFINLNSTFINACSGGILVEVSKKLTLTDKKLERFNASHAYKNVGMVISSIFRGFIIDLFGIKMNFMLAGVLSLFNVVGGIIYYESNLNKAKDEQNYQKFL